MNERIARRSHSTYDEQFYEFLILLNSFSNENHAKHIHTSNE